MQINGTSVRRVMGLAALLAVVAGTNVASAQQGDENVRGSFDQPLKRKGAQGGAKSNTTMMMSESDGEHSYSVKIQGDKVTAEVDGEEVPAKRVRQRDGRVEILDENGDVMKTFSTRVVTAPAAPMSPRFRVEAVPGERGAFGGNFQPMTPPKVMLGITMSDDEEGGARIESVIEGLPAEAAGLKVGDRVIKCNGKDVEDMESWRAMIREANPGDTMNLTVDRGGKNVDLKVKLAKWEQGKLPGMAQGGAPQAWSQVYGMGGEHMQTAREAVEKALKTLKDSKRVEGEALETARDALERALKALDEASTRTTLRFDNDRMLFGPEGQNWVFREHNAPRANDDLTRQLEKMNQQMEKLNKRLQDLEKDNNQR